MSQAFNKHQQRGFSLIEILVSTTILSFMMASIYTMVDQNAKTNRTVTVEDRDFLAGHIALNKVEEDLSQIYSSLYYAGRKRPRPDDPPQDQEQQATNALFPYNTIVDVPAPIIDSEDKSSIIFLSSSGRRKFEDQKQSHFLWIKYSIKSREKEADNELPQGDYQLVRQTIAENIYSPNQGWDKEREQVVLDNVKGFVIEYWDTKRKKFVESPKELDVDERLAPKGFQVKVNWLDRNGYELSAIKVIRPLWPAFDTLKDELERRPKVDPNKGADPNNPRFQPDDEEGDGFDN